MMFHLGNDITIHVWLASEWFWLWNKHHHCNDENYQAIDFYLGFLNISYTWSHWDFQD